MKTKLIIGNNKDELTQGLGMIAALYQKRPAKDGHKIFLVNRTFYQLTNTKPEVTPPDEREILFVSEEEAESLIPRKQIDSQMSISRISRGQNSENVCNSLIDWLLCFDLV